MLHPATLATCLLTLHRDEGGQVWKSTATGFLWKVESRWFLITNWHNITGLNPLTGQFIGTFCPAGLEAVFKTTGATIDGKRLIKNLPVAIDLYDQGSPTWLEHPTLRHRVDCVALPLDGISGFADSLTALSDADFVRDYQPGVGDECFVVGYPMGLSGLGTTPIWKRGSLATEPDLDHDRLPLLLVDTATRKGMSGSPVIVRHDGIFLHNGPALQDDDVFGTTEKFLGVYSGRLDDDPMGVQLGRVWKARAVDEIIGGASRGIHPHDIVFDPPK